MAKINIIGSGGWGTANAILLAKSGHEILLWSYLKEESDNLLKFKENKPFLPGVRIPDGVSFTSDISLCGKADLVVIAVPSHAVRSTCRSLAPHVSDGQLILNISKGFDEEECKRLSQVILSEIPGARVASMSGPSHAEEVALGMPTTNVVACADMECAEYIQDLYMSPMFRVYTSDDLIGLELGGSLKNIVALAAGICDGIGYGDNTKAALITRGLVEITRLGVCMGAKAETFSGLTGIGDLIVTCTSMHSRNRRAGILIGKGMTADEAEKEVKMTVEGIRACYSAYKLAGIYNVEMPIVEAIYKVLQGQINAKEATELLMGRSRKKESEREWLK
ncbi:MAG: NAD(P)-dependent glycerol-3-phosphate dehydrogenase [Clostridia bacterium]|nr:NAD(P)-dependent glycerol-3-phosphate dehydrogenase [Clostridia bacterium]